MNEWQQFCGILFLYFLPFFVAAGVVGIIALCFHCFKIALVSAIIAFAPLEIMIAGPILEALFCNPFAEKIGEGLNWVGDKIDDFACWAGADSLTYAVKKQNEEKVINLLKKGKNPNYKRHKDSPSALEESCRGYEDSEKADRITILLLDAGADPNDYNAIGYTFSYNRRKIVSELISHGTEINSRLFWLALEEKYFSEAEYMLSLTASPEDFYKNKSEMSVFMFFIKYWDKFSEENQNIIMRISDVFLEKGVDVNAVQEWGDTALHYFGKSHYEIDPAVRNLVNRLIKAGADPGLTNKYGESPLYYATSEYSINFPVIKLLVDSGADVNQKIEKGRTALMNLADESGTAEERLKAVKYLVSHGADITLKNGSGMTALDFVTTHNYKKWCLEAERPFFEEIERILTPKAPKVAVAFEEVKTQPEERLLVCEVHRELSDMSDNW